MRLPACKIPILEIVIDHLCQVRNLWRAAHLHIGSSHRLTSHQRSSFFNTNLTIVHSVEYLRLLGAAKALLLSSLPCALALISFTSSSQLSPPSHVVDDIVRSHSEKIQTCTRPATDTPTKRCNAKLHEPARPW